MNENTKKYIELEIEKLTNSGEVRICEILMLRKILIIGANYGYWR